MDKKYTVIGPHADEVERHIDKGMQERTPPPIWAITAVGKVWATMNTAALGNGLDGEEHIRLARLVASTYQEHQERQSNEH